MSKPGRISRRSLLSGATAMVACVAGARSACAQVDGMDAAQYGVQPDTSTDQTAAIQHAIDETRISGTPLFLRPGRYHAATLHLNAGARLVGIPGATRIVSTGGGPLISARGAARAGLAGLVLDGMARDLGDAQALVEMVEVDDVDVTDCAVENSWADGLYLRACGGRVAGSRIAGALGAALFSLDGRNLEISDNRVRDCGDNGIMVWQSEARSDGARITGNHVERIDNRSGGDGPYGNGIVVFRGGGVTVSNNRVTDCTFSAIRVNAGSDAIVSQNNCARLGEVAIFVEFEFNGAVISNNIVDRATHGISVTNFDRGGRLAVVSGNLVRNIEIGEFAEPRGNGIFVSADTTLTGNVVENAVNAGYALGYGPYLRDVAATGNIVRNAAVGFEISVVDGVKNVLVADNLISHVSRAAILGMEWEAAVTGDLAVEGAEDFPELTLSGNRVG
ncbi:TIGR03808 family TAT-translocated repetitive protein [Microbaculum marinum]|uniref:TIGR03808 family TAT-translocated repetitive protein n=1 Tax=Microbaculum marinum TaxID=1764581 RepID=A0AAW9RM93_9HYPH